MYTPDHLDRVVPLAGLPKSDVGAPMPIVLADESRVLIAYATRAPHPTWDGTNPRSVTPAAKDLTYALLEFDCMLHLFGYPNVDALGGHPLYKRGLKSYGAFEVLDSSWVRGLSAMNAVCFPQYPDFFGGKRHIVLTFHDTMFECVGRGFTVVGESIGARKAAVDLMNQRLDERSR